MNDEVLLSMGAKDLAMALSQRRVSAERLMEATLQRISATNERLNAVVSLRDTDELLSEARAVDKIGVKGPLGGLPTAIKDLAQAKGLPNSQGSPIFAGQISQQDDPHVAHMRKAGAIIIGKTNVPEFGLGSHSYNPVFGVTGNPYAPDRSAGGSSGGAAAALAMGMISIADGSDMMGSLRNPAGWCNVYGLRPTHGLVPGAEGGELYLHKLSTRGPMARSPGDLGMLLGVMAGSDAFDAVAPDAGGVRIGWLGNWGGALPMDPGILTLCETGLGDLEELGATVSRVALPVSRDVIWEAWTDLRSFTIAAEARDLYEAPDTRSMLKPEAVWEIERGLALSAMEVHEASLKRSEWYLAAMTLFESLDVLAMPSAQVWPFDAKLHWPPDIGGTKMDTYHRWMEVVIPASLLGLPAISVPVGFGENGLPMGLQLIGRPGADRKLLDLAEAYHQATDWPGTRAPLKM